MYARHAALQVEGDERTIAGKALGDFEREFQTPSGPVALLGTASSEAATLTLSDVAIYPIGAPVERPVGVSGVRAGLAELRNEVDLDHTERRGMR